MRLVRAGISGRAGFGIPSAEDIRDVAELRGYARALPQVRRALANVAVGMIFDDQNTCAHRVSIFCLPRKKKKHLHQGAIQEDFAVFLDGK